MTNELDFFSYITVIYLLEFRILVGPLLLELRVKFRFSALSGFFWGKKKGDQMGINYFTTRDLAGFEKSKGGLYSNILIVRVQAPSFLLSFNLITFYCLI